ncbi:MAG: glutamate-5-semialdehyde dehydrogenase [Spirochaetales bacterium]
MISESVFVSLRKASEILANLNAKEKNEALESVIRMINNFRAEILVANAEDARRATESGMQSSLVDRLLLTDERIDSITASIQIIISQTDPVGEVISGHKTENGMAIRQIRVPLGVAAIIYESRPNVTVDAFALAWKSGNAILLRGSSSALHSNRILVKAIQAGLTEINPLYANALALADGGREEVQEILQARGHIDVVLPRGGAALIKTVVENARIPVIETGSGVCHLFIDESADIDMAVNIAENGKLQRPGVCNALETLLIHASCAEDFLPKLSERFENRCELRCCKRSYDILMRETEKSKNPAVKNAVIKHATNEDFGFEFLDYILAIKIVDSVQEAAEHINAHNTQHSESIVTQSIENARFFQQYVDAACVYVNASTRFTDGGEFGFGAELGISTQKLHARGPMSLVALTTIKYLIDGKGHIR